MTIVPVANDVDVPAVDVDTIDEPEALVDASPPAVPEADHLDQVEQVPRTDGLPLLSVVVPAYNEALMIMSSLTTLYEYLQGLSDSYRFELIVVDDGSSDETGDIAEAFARARDEVVVLRHRVNFRLGQALRFGINRSRGDYVVTFDSDLSYEPGHIGALVSALREQHARIAVASPYMKGGKYSGLPWNRKVMSKGVNRILAASSQYEISTVTGLVRAYDGPFIRGLNLKSMGPEINTEILYKAQILRARVVEVPAHLDWTGQTERMKSRKVPLKVSTTSKLLMFSGFLFRPITVFLVPGLILLAIAVSTIGALALTVAREFMSASGTIDSRLYDAFGAAWQMRPQTFIIGGISLVVAVQFISIGLLATQAKRNFEELFHLDSRLLRNLSALDERLIALQSDGEPKEDA